MLLSNDVAQTSVLDFDTFAVVASWRYSATGCVISGYAAVGGFSATLLLPKNQLFYDFGDPARIMNSPSPVETPKALQGKPAEITSVYASATTVASRHIGPLISRYDYGSTSYATTLPTVKLDGYPVVVGTKVFAESFYGALGWSQIYRVNADASITLLRGPQGTHVYSFSTDGVTMSWTEAYGDPSPTTLQQPNIDVWSAPFTDDPQTIAQQAVKVGSLPNAITLPFAGETRTRGDIITTRHGTVGGGIVHVARRSDGHVKLVSPGPSRFFSEAAYATNTEVVATVNGDQPGQEGIALVRVGLGVW